ncbi:MAG: glycosyltransferase, partial [Deltaproteobacteria bacterium]
GRFVIMMVGRLAAEKRQETFLAAVRASRHRARIALVLAGTGPREEELRALAQEVSDQVEVGFLPRERLLTLLASADLLVHCSGVELEGLAVLEALGMGLPALVAEGPETAASDYALGPDWRFPVGDVAALTARIDRLVDEPERLVAARTASLVAAQRVSFDLCVARLESVYRQVLSCATQGRAAPSQSALGVAPARVLRAR